MVLQAGQLNTAIAPSHLRGGSPSRHAIRRRIEASSAVNASHRVGVLLPGGTAALDVGEQERRRRSRSGASARRNRTPQVRTGGASELGGQAPQRQQRARSAARGAIVVGRPVRELRIDESPYDRRWRPASTRRPGWPPRLPAEVPCYPGVNRYPDTRVEVTEELVDAGDGGVADLEDVHESGPSSGGTVAFTQ